MKKNDAVWEKWRQQNSREVFYSLSFFLSCFRCTEEFNTIYRYSLFTYHVWVMLTISCCLVSIQFQLVEYFDNFQEHTWKTNYFNEKNQIINAQNFSFLPLKWNDDPNVIEIISIALAGLYTFVFNSVVCELGQWMTNQYEVFEDELTTCDWYALPIEMQQLYLIFLLDAQQPIHIQCYGGIACSRETFKVVGFNGNQFSMSEMFLLMKNEFFWFISHFQITNKGFSYFMTLRKMRWMKDIFAHNVFSLCEYLISKIALFLMKNVRFSARYTISTHHYSNRSY